MGGSVRKSRCGMRYAEFKELLLSAGYTTPQIDRLDAIAYEKTREHYKEWQNRIVMFNQWCKMKGRELLVEKMRNEGRL